MKKKKIWIPIVSLVLVAALGTGLALYFTRKPGKTVGVYDSNQLTMTYWGDEKTSSGPVTTDKLQTVFLSATQEVTKVNVQQGQKVKKGTVLLTYDTTLSQLSLDRKELDIQKTKLRLEDAKDQLADIKKMKPISYNDNTKPTTKPTTKAAQVRRETPRSFGFARAKYLTTSSLQSFWEKPRSCIPFWKSGGMTRRQESS